jgi:hypothetical protein
MAGDVSEGWGPLLPMARVLLAIAAGLISPAATLRLARLGTMAKAADAAHQIVQPQRGVERTRLRQVRSGPILVRSPAGRSELTPSMARGSQEAWNLDDQRFLSWRQQRQQNLSIPNRIQEIPPWPSPSWI